MKFKFKKNSKFKKILCVVLVIGAVVGIGALVNSFARNDYKTVRSSEFSVGALDENGKYVEDKQSIYTKDAFECIGLRIEPDFESNVTYDVYYYDYNETLVEVKSGLDSVYDEDFPLAKLARIVIHPEIPSDVKEKDFKIASWEINSYAKNLKITVDKEQDYKYSDGMNLYVAEESTLNMNFQNGSDPSPANYNSKELFDATGTAFPVKVSNKINVDGVYDCYDIYVHLEANEGRWPVVALFGSDGKTIYADGDYVYDVVDASSVVKPIWVKLTIKVPSLESYEGVHLMVSMPDDSECYVFGYND